MDLLDKKFKDILAFIKEPHAGSLMGDKSICYLTFPPNKIIEVKRKLTGWISMAQHSDFKVTLLSLAEVLNQFFENNPNRNNWLQFEDVENKREVEELFHQKYKDPTRLAHLETGESVEDIPTEKRFGFLKKALLFLQES